VRLWVHPFGKSKSDIVDCLEGLVIGGKVDPGFRLLAAREFRGTHPPVEVELSSRTAVLVGSETAADNPQILRKRVSSDPETAR
jgi:hypothetical protein